jgi:flavodoxin
LKALVVYFSTHGNSKKIAETIAQNLDASAITPDQANIPSLSQYDIIGFGSGIYFNKHHQSLFDVVASIPPRNQAKAFIFSTNRDGRNNCHEPLREALKERGFIVVGEFACKGFETWRAVQNVGGAGINEGKPDTADLQKAEGFALELKKQHFRKFS